MRPDRSFRILVVLADLTPTQSNYNKGGRRRPSILSAHAAGAPMHTEHDRSGGEDIDGWEAAQAYGSPVLFVAVLFVMVGDVVTTAVGLQIGLQEGNPLVSTVIAWFGLPGMLATKALAAGALLVLPALTPESRWTFRVGSVVYLLIGSLVLASNLLSIWSVLG